MVINTNIAATNASRLLAQSTNMLNSSLARLSSGSKIVNPQDDAAGTAVSLRFNAQIGRTQAATNNVGSAISYNQTQDGFLQCQVSDAGPARRDDSGIPPRAVPWPAKHGHGLWIVAQVTDKSSIDHGPAGTTVTARFALSPARS